SSDLSPRVGDAQQKNPNYGRIVNVAHFDRLNGVADFFPFSIVDARNSVCPSRSTEVRKMRRSWYLFIILFVFFVSGATAVLAQGSGSSVMIYNKAKTGTEDNSVGEAFEQALIKGLEEKYPC